MMAGAAHPHASDSRRDGRHGPTQSRRDRAAKLHMVLTADWDQPLPHEDWHGLDRQSEDVAETEKD